MREPTWPVAGSRVAHARFGCGVVRSVRPDGACQVAFEGQAGTRWIRPSFLEDPQVLAAALPGDAGWPHDTFEPEGPEVVHFMGSHWEPFGLDAKDLVLRLPQMLPDARVAGGWTTQHPALRKLPTDWPPGALLVWPGPDHGVGLVLRLQPERNLLVSLFPFHQRGTQVSLRVRQVRIWEGGLEAQVTADWGDAEVTFFDTRHVIDRAWYSAGRLDEFVLCGIAYSAAPACSRDLPFEWTSELVEKLGKVVPPEDLPEPGPATLSLEGMACLLPVAGWDADDYAFRGPIREVGTFCSWLGQDGWTARTTVLRAGPGGRDQDLDIHITRQSWAGEAAPAVGQHIEGRLWLQGYLWAANRGTCGR